VRECEECGGSGATLVTARIPGEGNAAEWIEVECPHCDGAGEIDD
jgi:DnaJ-class molecular chaperone